MPDPIEVAPIAPDTEQLQQIAVEAHQQGYAFVDRLIEEAKSGANSFDKRGECFCGVFVNGALVGCGGINRDPYVDQDIGRLRHVYVLERVRRTGVATVLVHELLRRSKAAFSTIRLRTPDQNADRFYEALGFVRVDEHTATHVIKI